MGLVFKPGKCRTLSICGGKPNASVKFAITDSNNSDVKVHMETTHSKPHKFLGSKVTHNNTQKEYFEFFYETLENKLKNIDESKVRGEHKLAIYERYSLPSMRYHFSIHDQHNTHLDKLDALAKTYIKKWLHYPTRGVTDVGIFHPYLLNIKQPSQVYLESHTSNLALWKKVK